jgi:hypothetical protein
MKSTYPVQNQPEIPKSANPIHPMHKEDLFEILGFCYRNSLKFSSLMQNKIESGGVEEFFRADDRWAYFHAWGVGEMDEQALL